MEMDKDAVRLIALDLDGTLLNTEKRLTLRSREALAAADRAGIEIVPATGRFFRGIPEEIRSLPFLRYAITVNGAQVWDIGRGRSLYSADIPLERALEVMAFLDTQPVIYDCYQEGWGYITEELRRQAMDYIDYPPSLEMLCRLRSGVPELKAWLRERGQAVQKIQLYTKDRALREKLLSRLAEEHTDLAVSNSLPNNVEINAARANKGDALLALAERLGLDRKQTMAFGDGLNDLSMLRAAGIGVAMAKCHPALIEAADLMAGDCDSDGAAKVIESLLA